MAIVLQREKETATENSLSVPYFVEEDDGSELDRAAAESAAISAFNTDTGLVSTGKRATRLGRSAVRVVVRYRPLQVGNLTPPSIGTTQWGFEYSMPPLERQFSLETIATYPNDALDFQGLINVRPGAGIAIGAGVRLSPPPIKLWERRTVAASELTQEKADAIALVVGKTNTEAVGSGPSALQPGELCLVRATGSLISDEQAQFYYGYGRAETVTETIGEFSVTRSSFEYAWPYTSRKLVGDSGNKSIAPFVDAVYVERVLEEASYSAL